MSLEVLDSFTLFLMTLRTIDLGIAKVFRDGLVPLRDFVFGNNPIPEVLRQLICLHHCDKGIGDNRCLFKTQNYFVGYFMSHGQWQFNTGHFPFVIYKRWVKQTVLPYCFKGKCDCTSEAVCFIIVFFQFVILYFFRVVFIFFYIRTVLRPEVLGTSCATKESPTHMGTPHVPLFT